MALGKIRDNAASTARSDQSNRGLGILRRSTTTSWRNAKISASFHADDRASNTNHDNIRTKIKYSSRTATAVDHHLRQIARSNPLTKFSTRTGTAYARAYTDDVADPSFLWQEPGGAFLASSGLIPELQPLDLLLEQPETVVERRQLDLVTGRLNPDEPGKRVRSVFRPAKRKGEVVQTEDDEDQVEARGKFIPCGVCKATPRYGRSTVQDHQTKRVIHAVA